MQNLLITTPNITSHISHFSSRQIMWFCHGILRERPTIFFKKWLQLEEIASAAAHEFQKWNHWSRNSTPGAWKIFLGGKKMWWPHGSHLGCLMLAHSAFLGLVVVVVFSDGGAQNHIFGYIIGISHFHFLPIFFIYLIKALLLMPQLFWPKRFLQISQRFGKKMKKKNWSNRLLKPHFYKTVRVAKSSLRVYLIHL